MKTILADSHSYWSLPFRRHSVEGPDVKVSISDKLELRIGRGTRARIAVLAPWQARQLAHALIEKAAEIDAKTQRRDGYRRGYKAGFNLGFQSGKREGRLLVKRESK